MGRRNRTTLHKDRNERMREFPPMECPNIECDGELRVQDIGRRTEYVCTNAPKCRVKKKAFSHGKLLGRPVAIPADKETSSARVAAHFYLDQLWKYEGSPMTRARAYEWLLDAMNHEALSTGIGGVLTEEECHIGRFTKEQCTTACILVSKYLRRLERGNKN